MYQSRSRLRNAFEEINSPSRNAGGSAAMASWEGQCPVSYPFGPTFSEGRVNFETRS